jgi:hypothetical protein
MMRKFVLGAILVTAGLVVSTGHNAFACNRTAGCVMDSLHEDYDMKRDGRMDKAMIAGRANVEAFRALQGAQQAYSAKK